MARRSPVEKRSRRAGVELGLKGARQVAGTSGHTRRPYPPGQQGRAGQPGRRRKRDSDYLAQLKEKQKLQWFYGIQAGQLRRYYDASRRQPEATGDELLRLLEQRLDNIVYRLGFAGTRAQALMRDAISLGFRVPDWVAADQEALSGRVLHHPQRAEVDVPAEENRVVEFFAKF